MKERTRRIDAKANRESDGVIVPEKQSNRETPVLTETVEVRPPAKRNAGEEATNRIQSRNMVSFGLEGVRTRAKTDKTCCFTALLHHITPELLRQSFYELNRKAAPGIDGVTWQTYEEQLEERLPTLHTEIHKGSYRAKPVLRTYIPKADGHKRPLGITAIEDKLVQQAVVSVLTVIYETEFYGFSYGYRPGRSQHGALDALATAILTKRINWILDADLQGFFDSIPHERLLEFIRKRVGDKRILRLISKWLKTGYSEEGRIYRQTVGTPQGSVISPLLANIYLHYVLDEWVENERRTRPNGEVIIVRYADDSAPRRRTGGRKSSVQPSCTRDEGGPFGVAVQAETSNHLLLLHLRDVVVSESGKGRARPCQIRTVESNANEPLMTCRKRRNDVKTGRESLTRDKSGSNLLTGQTASGIKAARTRFRLLCGTWEPVTPMLREKHKERSSKCQSTDAGYRGGVTCNSDEGSVMELERRGYPIQSETCEQPAMGGFA